ncbi:hypothetical protein RvY_12341 [Ramazzottius varieornatus]|uniref:Uncharacterized protein n=1 Tax=Ramazzottius varieornatus TaxID=947166 RepID=A0A1D1VND3_RAMVA|nr:hypothetical protein RvY_12341 [Ramazzottius varieornatus]
MSNRKEAVLALCQRELPLTLLSQKRDAQTPNNQYLSMGDSAWTCGFGEPTESKVRHSSGAVSMAAIWAP